MDEAAQRSKKRVLIVDDQPANVHIIAEALGDSYELRFATAGEKAIEMVESGAIDLVLLDIVMPEMDGLEVCRRLKESESTSPVPVIFVTAREEVQDEAKGFEAGGVDYITKPISPPIVRARVRTHLELKETRDLLERLALVDALTGIPNRRRFDDRLDHEWRQAARKGHCLSLAIIDVDDFKRYNDRYGHARGDECLRVVASTLADLARRPGDLAARYGGEEFAVVLPETGMEGMRNFLEALLAGLWDEAMVHEGSTCSDRVTVSGGAVSVVPSRNEGPEAMLEEADRLLYRAKAAGRNRCIQSDLRDSGEVHIEPPSPEAAMGERTG